MPTRPTYPVLPCPATQLPEWCHLAPFPLRCDHRPVTITDEGVQVPLGSRCDETAVFWILGPDGVPTGAAYCAFHAGALVNEYLAKLGERWMIEPVRLYSDPGRPLTLRRGFLTVDLSLMPRTWACREFFRLTEQPVDVPCVVHLDRYRDVLVYAGGRS